MIVRVRCRRLPQRGPLRIQQLSSAVALLLAPTALVAFLMAAWILAAQLQWMGDFFLTSGVFSHWQVWLSVAAVLLFLSRLLDRYGRMLGEYSLSKERAS